MAGTTGIHAWRLRCEQVVGGLLAAVFGRLAADTLCRVGVAGGRLAFHLGLRRRVVADNLRRALAMHGTARRHTALRAYQTMGANFLEIWCHEAATLEAKLHHLNPTWHARIHQRYHGRVVYVSLHLGQWDLMGVRGRYFDPDGRQLVMAKDLTNRILSARLNRRREALGMEVINVSRDSRRALSRALQAIRRGRAIGMLADQGPRPRAGWPVTFLGQPTYAFPGPALIAAKTGAVIVPAVGIRTGIHRTALYIGQPIAADNPEVALQAILDRFATFIHRCPGQYFWHHRRFKYSWSPGRQDGP